MKFYKNFAFFVLALLVLSIVAVIRTRNTQPPVYHKVTGFTQGTTFSITYEDNGVGDLSVSIDSVLRAFDLSLSTYIPNSLISKINRNEQLTVSDPLFLEVFNVAREVFEQTNGYFDITVGPLVKAYGFLNDSVIAPDNHTIDSLLQYVGFDKILIQDGRILKENPNILLDVNAIAQGYSVDVMASFLESKKIKNYLVEIGGEIKAKGVNPSGVTWRIGLDRPVENNNVPGQDLFVKMKLENMSLATSGNYRKYYEEAGIKYTHSINPKTGKTVSRNLLSATVFSKQCITADAYATACMVVGLEQAIEYLERIPEIWGYLIYSDEKGNYQVYISPETREFLLD
ncbi:MAG: FAD:protein FMN transferase [Bacteroidota bacterium]